MSRNSSSSPARPVIECVISAPGYRSSIELPIDAGGPETQEAFCAWFKMQLDYFARWKPGSTANDHETTPLTSKGDA